MDEGREIEEVLEERIIDEGREVEEILEDKTEKL